MPRVVSTVDEPLCVRCGERLASAQAAQHHAGLCELCRRAEPAFAKAVAYGSYDGPLRELLHLFKYDAVRSAEPVLAGMLAEAVRELVSESETEEVLLVPVPLFRGKERSRGFNQAERIARIALKRMGAEARPALRLETDALARVRDTRSQTGLTRHQRRENVRGAFAVANPARVRDREVIVVDDVFTTGTTARECAKVLLRAGAKRVQVATVARVFKLTGRLNGELNGKAGGGLSVLGKRDVVAF